MTNPADKNKFISINLEEIKERLAHEPQPKARQAAPPREWEIVCEEMECSVSGPDTDGNTVKVIEAAPVLALVEKLEKAFDYSLSMINTPAAITHDELIDSCAHAEAVIYKALAELATFRGLTSGDDK